MSKQKFKQKLKQFWGWWLQEISKQATAVANDEQVSNSLLNLLLRLSNKNNNNSKLKKMFLGGHRNSLSKASIQNTSPHCPVGGNF